MSQNNRFIFNAGKVLLNMQNVTDKLDYAVLGLARVSATKMEAYAKQNRRWKDRTGNARQFLKGAADFGGHHDIHIWIRHHMWYGYNLELDYGRKYMILEEAMDANTGELLRSLKKLF